MKKLYAFNVIWIVACLIAANLISLEKKVTSAEVDHTGISKALEAVKSKRTEKARSAKQSAEYIYAMKANQHTGTIDLHVVKEVQEQIRMQRLEKAGALLDWEELGPDNVGGRTRGMVIDKDDPKVLIAGGVAGGIWKSENAGGLWRSIENSFEVGCVAVSCLTQGPTGDLYAGTGEGFYTPTGNGGNGIYGSGIYKSTDRGETWTLCAGSAPPVPSNTSNHWATVDKIAAHPSDPNIVYAATRGGMYLTSDGGETWTRPTDTEGNDITTGRGWDVKVSSNGSVHFATGSRQYRSVSAFQFERMDGNGSGQIPSSIFRRSISISPVNPDLIYIIAAGDNDSGPCVDWIRRSLDNGTSWQVIANGADTFAPGSNAIQCQSWYNLAIGAHPTREDLLYVGGVTLWRGEQEGDGWNWLQVDNLSEDPANISYVHADKHDIVFKPDSDLMYVIGDGGVFWSQNASDEIPVFEMRNKNYNVTQYYSISAGHDGKVLGGTQDNGSQFLNCSFNSATASVEVFGSDGGFSEVSNINPNALYVGIPGGRLFRSGNGGDGFGGGLFDCNIDCFTFSIDNNGDPNLSPGPEGECNADMILDGTEANPGGAFVTPFVLWEDTELYYKIKGVELGPNQPFQLESYRGVDYIVTRDPDLSVQSDDIATNPIEIYNENEVFIAWDESKGSAKNYPPSDFRYVRSRMFIGDEAGQLWMSLDALNFQTTPFWTKIGTAPGAIRSISVSPDGNTVWAGTTNGRLMRVNKLNDININDIKLNDSDLCTGSGIASFEQFAAVVPNSLSDVSGRHITGFAYHPFDSDQMYFSAGSYNNDAFVFKINEAAEAEIGDIEIEAIQGNLPPMPVYDLVVDALVPKHLIAATEFGVWAANTDLPLDDMWSEENGGELHPVPTFSLREEYMAKSDAGVFTFCKVLYAGTHGRGAFRTTSLTNGACANVVQGCVFEYTSIEEIMVEDILTYPNPATDQVNVRFDLTEDQDMQIALYSMTAQLLDQKTDYDGQAGSNTVSFDVSNLPPAHYIINFNTGQGQRAVKFSVIR